MNEICRCHDCAMSSGPHSTAMAFAVAGAVGLLAGCLQSPSTRTVEVPWTLVRSSPASSTVDVQYYHGDCDTQPSARVDATNVTVRITVLVRESTGPCDDMSVLSYARVRLGSQLGNRRLLGWCTASTNPLCTDAGQTNVPRHPPVLGS